MFLVSKDGMRAVEVEQVEMWVGYSDQVINEANQIYNKIKNDALQAFLGILDADKMAKTKAEEYLDGKKTCIINVNGKNNFGDYGEEQGKIVFEEIVNALKNESAYFDMREVDFGGIDNAD